MVSTSGFIEEIPKDEQAIIYCIATAKINQKTDFIIFDPEMDKTAKPQFEDDGRSFHIPMNTIPKKVYVKLDDFGSKETLSENVGHPVQTQFLITFMLAEEY